MDNSLAVVAQSRDVFHVFGEIGKAMRTRRGASLPFFAYFADFVCAKHTLMHIPVRNVGGGRTCLSHHAGGGSGLLPALRELLPLCQILVDCGGSFSAFSHRENYGCRAQHDIASRVDAFQRGLVLFVDEDVSSLVDL